MTTYGVVVLLFPYLSTKSNSNLIKNSTLVSTHGYEIAVVVCVVFHTNQDVV